LTDSEDSFCWVMSLGFDFEAGIKLVLYQLNCIKK